MDNRSSHTPRPAVNLKQLPPIDPFRITNSSSKGKLHNSRIGGAPKFVKPSPNQGVKLVDFDKAASLISPIKKIETCGNTTSPTQTESVHEGMKKGTARSNLYEICAVKHWKPPIFECCKEEGPSHQRIFTFKVIIETEESSRNIIECYSAPHRKKKAAADHAAEGALWLGCQFSTDHAFFGESVNPVPVKSRVLFLVGVLPSQRQKESSLEKGFEAFLLCSLVLDRTFGRA